MRQLRYQLARYLGCPVCDLVADEVNILLTIINNLVVLLVLRDLLMQLIDLLRLLGHAQAFAGVRVLLVAVIVNLKNMKFLLFLIILRPQLIKLLFILAHCAQELRIRLLPREELVYHFLNVTVASGGSDLAEGVLEVAVLIHLILHLLLEELTPQFLHLEVGTGADLALVPVLVRSCFSNLLLFLDTINALLQGLLLILDTILQPNNPLIPLLLLVLNVLH